MQFVGKGDGKSKGKGGFQGQCWTCLEFGHSQRFCPKGKGKAADKGAGKGYGKDNFKGGFQVKGFGKGYGWYGKGKGEFGKGIGAQTRACFGCGSTEHLLRDCPKNPGKVNQVVQEQEEILFIGNVRDEWRQVPMKVVPTKLTTTMPRTKLSMMNRFKVLEVDEEEQELESQVFAVTAEEGPEPLRTRKCSGGDSEGKIVGGTRVDSGKVGAFGPVEVHSCTDPQPSTRREVNTKGHGIEKDWGGT